MYRRPPAQPKQALLLGNCSRNSQKIPFLRIRRNTQILVWGDGEDRTAGVHGIRFQKRSLRWRQFSCYLSHPAHLHLSPPTTVSFYITYVEIDRKTDLPPLSRSNLVAPHLKSTPKRICRYHALLQRVVYLERQNTLRVCGEAGARSVVTQNGS